MGSSGSTVSGADRIRETVRQTIINSNKPLDASDVEDLNEAREEIARLRTLALQLYEMSDGPKLPVDGVLWKTAKEEIKGRGAVIAKDNYSNDKNFEKRVFEKTELQAQSIIQSIKRNILFTNCNADQLQEIVEIFEPISFEQGQTIIQRGDQGRYFYVVESGTLDLFLFSNERQEEFKVAPAYTEGDCFGELALMYNQPRAATIKARTNSCLWQLEGSAYRALKRRFNMETAGQSLQLLSNVAVGSTKLNDVLSSSELHQMASAFEVVEFKYGDVIVRQGESGDDFYIIQQGEVFVHKVEEENDKSLNQGLGPKVGVLTNGNYFGERALLSEETRAATCVANSERVTCLSLDREDFILILGTLEEKQKTAQQEQKTPDENQNGDHHIIDISMESHNSETFNLNDYTVGQTLGCGAFGTVKLVTRKGDKSQCFAMKSQSLALIVENSMQQHIVSERRVLKKMNHPFILKLHASFKDNRYIYFIMELLNGGELFTHLKRHRKFTEAQAKFFSASVVLAFEEMHGHNIIFRDLKPENIVLDSQGYPKLVDFGLAKIMENPKTFTICGTPDYLAPEIILNEGHDKAVDYWAIGVLTYELVYGDPPFLADDPMAIYENIITGRLSMFSTPGVTPSRPLTSVLKKLMKHNKNKRLGYIKGGVTSIIKHKWFNGFDWESLRQRTLAPPICPEVSGPDDVSNFTKCIDDHRNAPVCLEWDPDWN